MPGRRQRAGLGLTVPDHAGHQQIRIVQRGAVGVRQRVAQFAPFVQGTRRLRRHMAGHAAGRGELREQPVHARLVPADIGIELAVAALQPGVRQHRGCAVARPPDADRRPAPRPDDPVEMGVDQVEAGARPPVPEQPGFDVRRFERRAQQRIRPQVELSGGQIAGGAPVCLQRVQLGGAERGAVVGPAWPAADSAGTETSVTTNGRRREARGWRFLRFPSAPPSSPRPAQTARGTAPAAAGSRPPAGAGRRIRVLTNNPALTRTSERRAVGHRSGCRRPPGTGAFRSGAGCSGPDGPSRCLSRQEPGAPGAGLYGRGTAGRRDPAPAGAGPGDGVRSPCRVTGAPAARPAPRQQGASMTGRTPYARRGASR